MARKDNPDPIESSADQSPYEGVDELLVGSQRDVSKASESRSAPAFDVDNNLSSDTSTLVGAIADVLSAPQQVTGNVGRLGSQFQTPITSETSPRKIATRMGVSPGEIPSGVAFEKKGREAYPKWSLDSSRNAPIVDVRVKPDAELKYGQSAAMFQKLPAGVAGPVLDVKGLDPRNIKPENVEVFDPSKTSVRQTGITTGGTATFAVERAPVENVVKAEAVKQSAAVPYGDRPYAPSTTPRRDLRNVVLRGSVMNSAELEAQSRARDVATGGSTNPYIRYGRAETLEDAWDAEEADTERAKQKSSPIYGPPAPRSGPRAKATPSQQAPDVVGTPNVEKSIAGKMLGRLAERAPGITEQSKSLQRDAVRIDQMEDIENPVIDRGGIPTRNIVGRYITASGRPRSVRGSLSEQMDRGVADLPLATSGPPSDAPAVPEGDEPVDPSITRSRMSGMGVINVSREAGVDIAALIAKRPEYKGKVSTPQVVGELGGGTPLQRAMTATAATSAMELHEDALDALNRAMTDTGAPRKGASGGASEGSGYVGVRKIIKGGDAAARTAASVEAAESMGPLEERQAEGSFVSQPGAAGRDARAKRNVQIIQRDSRKATDRAANRRVGGEAGPLAGPGGGNRPINVRTAEERRRGRPSQ
jgi:hypothetical protein